ISDPRPTALAPLSLHDALPISGMAETLAKVTPDHHVLVEEIGEVLFRVPAGIPRLDDAKPKSDGMSFLTHSIPPLVRHHDGEMTELFFDSERTPLGARTNAFDQRAGIHRDGLD